MLTVSHSDFWTRIDFQEEHVRRCIRAVEDAYHGHEIARFEEQGYCSFTFLLTPSSGSPSSVHGDALRDSGRSDSFLVQLRPPQHALDISIMCAASATYPSIAPQMKSLGLQLPGSLCAYQMERLCGTPFNRIQLCHATLDAGMRKKGERLITSFADLLAHVLRSSVNTTLPPRVMRADSPIDDVSNMLSRCTGRVGSSILPRLRKLATELPDADLRDKAASVLCSVRDMRDYPVVLNHGDLIPPNILVDNDTWEITGLVDWAEAEYLPFGTCLYGLENLLGYLEPVSSTRVAPEFVYLDNAPQLRDMFWSRLLHAVPDLAVGRRDVEVMRDLGVLLWYGIAWDNGALDRVVNEKDDAEVLTCLRAFMDRQTDK